MARRRLHEQQMAFFELDYDDVDDGYSPRCASGDYTPRAWVDVPVSPLYL